MTDNYLYLKADNRYVGGLIYIQIFIFFLRAWLLKMHRSTGQGPELAGCPYARTGDQPVSLPIPSRSVVMSHLRRLIIRDAAINRFYY